MNKIRLDNRYFYYQVFLKNNKNIYLRLKNDCITITLPRNVKGFDPEDFILKHQNFILKQAKIAKNPLYDEKKIPILGVHYDIDQVLGKELVIEGIKYKLPNNFDLIKIEKFYRTLTVDMANMILENDLKNRNFDIDISDLIIRSQLMKTRLGSCNALKRKINLNSILARFEIKYLRAVLIHEIVHLKVRNHQKKFYDELLRIEPDYYKLNKELRENIRRIEI
jgi:predicted metal-dependent hydrolase